MHETPPRPTGLKCALNPLSWPGGMMVTPATFATAFVIARVGCRAPPGGPVVTEPSGYDLETRWEDEEFVLSRGVRAGEPSPFLVVAPASAQPSPGSLARLEHAHGRRAELHPAWAARPLRLVRDRGRPPLVLEDPGGEPLARLLGQPWEIASFL